MNSNNAVLCFAIGLLLPPPVLAQSPIPDRIPLSAKRLDNGEIKALMGTGATFTFVGAGGKATGRYMESEMVGRG